MLQPTGSGLSEQGMEESNNTDISLAIGDEGLISATTQAVEQSITTLSSLAKEMQLDETTGASDDVSEDSSEGGDEEFLFGLQSKNNIFLLLFVVYRNCIIVFNRRIFDFYHRCSRRFYSRNCIPSHHPSKTKVSPLIKQFFLYGNIFHLFSEANRGDMQKKGHQNQCH